MKFYKHRFAVFVNKSETNIIRGYITFQYLFHLRVNTKAFNLTETSRSTSPRQSPHDGMYSFSMLTKEVIGRVMRSGSLRNLCVLFGFTGMNQVGEFDSI